MISQQNNSKTPLTLYTDSVCYLTGAVGMARREGFRRPEMSYFQRTFTIATASSVPAGITLPDDLDARCDALKAYPIKQCSWRGRASDATVAKWLNEQGLVKAAVSVSGAHKGRSVEISRRIVSA